MTPAVLFAVFLNESCNPRDTLNDVLVLSRIAKADVLTFIWNSMPKMYVGKHRNTSLMQQTLAKHLRVVAAGHGAGLGHVWPSIEGAAGRLAMNAWYLIE